MEYIEYAIIFTLDILTGRGILLNVFLNFIIFLHWQVGEH